MFVRLLVCFVVLTAAHSLSVPRSVHRRLRNRASQQTSTVTTQQESSSSTFPYHSRCQEHFFTQRLDHFTNRPGPDNKLTFEQRYFICNEDVIGHNVESIFFYCGNEANVEEYMKYTGLMWENSEAFNAILVFAEHRYYGQSLPYAQREIIEDHNKLMYCTIQQTLEDFAALIAELQKTKPWMGVANAKTHGITPKVKKTSETWDGKLPLIGFGGSYGGMLAALFRMKYPHLMDGAIASSAPLLGIHGLNPPANPYSFAEIETKDCHLATPYCVENIANVWKVIDKLSQTPEGRQELSEAFNLCDTPDDADIFSQFLSDYIEEAIAYMAMSSYPYESGYITQAILDENAKALPAYPIEYGCQQFLNTKISSDKELLEGVVSFINVFWDSFSSDTCVDLNRNEYSFSSYVWDFIYCDSFWMPSGTNGYTDMFEPSLWNDQLVSQWCFHTYNIQFAPSTAQQFGLRQLFKSATNIVFSNGELDPWLGGGVTPEDVASSDSLISVSIEKAGHHQDLMFANENDQESVIEARRIEVQNIKRWIEEAKKKASLGVCPNSEGKNKKSRHGRKMREKREKKKKSSWFLPIHALL